MERKTENELNPFSENINILKETAKYVDSIMDELSSEKASTGMNQMRSVPSLVISQ